MGEREWSWTAIKAAHANTRTSATIPLDSAAVAELKQLLDRHDRLRDEESGGLVEHGEELAALKDQIRALRQRAEESEVLFVFEGIGRSRAGVLLAEHPAPDGQADDDLYGPAPGWNSTTYPPAVLAESCVQPADLHGNHAAWREIHDTWSAGALARLWNAYRAAQQSVAVVPKRSAVSAALGESSSAES